MTERKNWNTFADTIVNNNLTMICFIPPQSLKFSSMILVLNSPIIYIAPFIVLEDMCCCGELIWRIWIHVNRIKNIFSYSTFSKKNYTACHYRIALIDGIPSSLTINNYWHSKLNSERFSFSFALIMWVI